MDTHYNGHNFYRLAGVHYRAVSLYMVLDDKMLVGLLQIPKLIPEYSFFLSCFLVVTIFCNIVTNMYKLLYIVI